MGKYISDTCTVHLEIHHICPQSGSKLFSDTPCQAVPGALQSADNHTYTVSQKNDTDVSHYNCHAQQPILVIFGRDVAERV